MNGSDTYIRARTPTHTHTPYTHTHIYIYIYIYIYTYIYPHTHTYTHTHAHIHKQGVTLHILVSGISSEGAVDRHSGVSQDGTTAQVHVTNFVN